MRDGIREHTGRPVARSPSGRPCRAPLRAEIGRHFGPDRRSAESADADRTRPPSSGLGARGVVEATVTQQRIAAQGSSTITPIHVRNVPEADIINGAPRVARAASAEAGRLAATSRSDPWAHLMTSTGFKVLRRLNSDRTRQPPAQYVQPASWARFTPHVPEGMMVIPATTFAAHSFAASSAVTLALLANILL